MTNIEKALALINTFATGDTEKAASLLAKGYIQHNLAYGTGRDAFVGSVAWLASAPVKTTVQNIRAFEDGDKVFLQTVYNFAGAGEQVAFDIFRFDADGKIAEHWDNLAAKADPNPSGHTQIDGTLEKRDVDKEETRRIVAGFVGDVLRGENPDKLTSYYDGDRYIQHNVSIADGLSGLGAALAAMAEQGISMVYDKTHMGIMRLPAAKALSVVYRPPTMTCSVWKTDLLRSIGTSWRRSPRRRPGRTRTESSDRKED